MPIIITYEADKVIRSKHRKKNIAIEVTEEGEVVLRVPLNTKDVEIEKFLFLGEEYPLKFGREGFVLSDRLLRWQRKCL